MKARLLAVAVGCCVLWTANIVAAELYVDLNSANPVSPYTNWNTAAVTIQDAVDAASSGDTVFVTNGIYQTGGRVADMTNRLVLNNLITVQSINGPAVTVIKGYQVPGTTNGVAAVRAVYLAGGATLSGFTVTGGATKNSDSFAGGIRCNTTGEIITNCVITGNASAAYAGGVYYGTLYNCVISQNVATADGGGTYHSHLYNCLATTNSADNGGGASFGFLNNCVLVGNSARATGGGVHYISSMKNCTIVANSAGFEGGGVYGGGVLYQNCIIYYNTAYGGGASKNVYLSSATINNCCLTPRTSGTGNITNEPAFVDMAGGNYRLQIGSPCIDAGTNLNVYWSADIDGNPRIFGSTVDIGAYENQYTGVARYVSLSCTNPMAPYTNWITAATNIQDAVGAALDGEIVVVGDGIYGTGGAVIYGQETNRVALTNGITLLSFNGAQSVAIVGGTQTRGVYVGSNSVLIGFTITNGHARNSGDVINERNGGGIWCDTSGVVSNCVICNSVGYDGGGVFGGTLYNCTLTGNQAYIGGGAFSNTAWNCTFSSNSVSYGGGGAASASLFNCLIVSNGLGTLTYGSGVYQVTLSNCTLLANGCYSVSGGGAYQSTLYNCILLTNYSGYGAGGAQYSELYNCTLKGNDSDYSSGGAYQCTNYNCTLLGNSGSSGGGLSGGISYNCLLTNNTARYNGGGAYQGTLYNCVLSGNIATNANPSIGKGGGASGTVLVNCTVANNLATSSGGGIYGGTAYNSIIYFNTAPGGPNWTNSPAMYYCCTTPFNLNEMGCFTNDPTFVDIAGGDFRLKYGSPCIDAGFTNSYIFAATNDIRGVPRPLDGNGDGVAKFDLGAYEFDLLATVGTNWLAGHGLDLNDPLVFTYDPDHDGFTTLQEWVAGTDPTNPASFFQIASVSNLPPVTVWIQSSSSRRYSLLSSPDLPGTWAPVPGQANVPGTDGLLNLTDTNPAAQQFYRVQVTVP